ncbi:MAG: peptidylprolyl isomerase [Candidatus Obscuribacterales bacterium]|nr:peptidylprolyl isomerase [Candidatus Obscuribacterales bacterium]
MSTGEPGNNSAAPSSATRQMQFVQLGNLKITPFELVQGLIIGGQWTAIEQVLNEVLIRRELQDRGLSPDQEHLSRQIIAFRKNKGLISAEDMQVWLANHHLTDVGLVSMCAYEAGLELLKEALFAESIEKYFELRRLSLNCVEMYKIVTGKEEAAKEMVAAIREDNASFFDFARRYSTDTKTNLACGYQGKVAVASLQPQVQELIADSPEGALIGPVKIFKHYEIILVHKFHKASLDAETREKLMQELFDQWLTETRSRNPLTLNL